MTKVIMHGCNGKMGQTVKNTAASHSHLEVVAGVDKYKDILPNPFPVFEHIEDCDVDVDVIIDFSRPDALEANLAYATKHNTPMVIATTGFSDSQYGCYGYWNRNHRRTGICRKVYRRFA